MSHVTYPRRAPHPFLVALALSLLIQPSAHAQRRPQLGPSRPRVARPAGAASTTIPGRLAGGGTLDTEGLLARHLMATRARQTGSAAQLSARQIEIAPGQRTTLAQLAPTLFAEQNALQTQLNRARGATLGAVETHDEVYDLGDRVVIARTTRVILTNPDLAQRSSPIVRSFLQGRGSPPRSIDPETRAGLAQLRQELASAPPQHPLRAAADQGDEALLAAISRGEGELEVVDTFVLPTAAVPTRNGAVMLPSTDGMRFDYARPRTDVMRVPPPREFATAAPIDHGPQVGSSPTVDLTPGAPAEVGTTNGPAITHTYEFMNGFTIGRAWEWERRWNYPSGFFRVTFKAGLGFGLRIPIRAHVTLNPGYMRVVDTQDRPSAFMTAVRYETVDATSDFYSRTGISQGQLFDGKELVIRAFVGYGYKFRALWKDWSYRPYEEWGFDYGQNFVPPQSANWQSIREFFIPAEITRTVIDLGIIEGRLEAGVQLGARGRVSGVFRSFIDGQRVQSQFGNQNALEWRRDFQFPQQSITFGTPIAPFSRAVSASRTYGYEIGDLRYTSDWSIVPGAKVSVRVGIDGFSRTFNHTIWIEDARINLGSITLDPHDGTRRWNGNQQAGRKYFQNAYDVQTGPG